MEPTFAALVSAITVAGSAVAAYGGTRFAAGKETAEREAMKSKILELEKKLVDEIQVVHERISKSQREHDANMTRYSDKLDTMLAGLSKMEGKFDTFIEMSMKIRSSNG